jgi:hypothetical protein
MVEESMRFLPGYPERITVILEERSDEGYQGGVGVSSLLIVTDK